MSTTRHGFLLSTVLLLAGAPAYAGQAPFAAEAPDFPISGRDRVYAAEQFSNTVSVIDPPPTRTSASFASAIRNR